MITGAIIAGDHDFGEVRMTILQLSRSRQLESSVSEFCMGESSLKLVAH